MKIVNSSVEIMRHGMEIEPIIPEQFIERVGRTCYKSEDKITETSAEKFVSGLIKRGHEAMIEHWSLIFETGRVWYEEFMLDWNTLMHNKNLEGSDGANLRPFIRFTECTLYDGENRFVISGNMRAWRDYAKKFTEYMGFIPGYLYGMIRNYPLFFPEYQDYVPGIISNHIMIPISVRDLTLAERRVHQDITVKFICDRGVSHEIVRHRPASFAQESTRYCNYGLEKFGKEITVVEPSWCEHSDDVYSAWVEGCTHAEDAYFKLIDIYHCTPQEARSVLPNSLKTEIIVTANVDEWDHFFELRCAADAHPDIRRVAALAKAEFDSLGI